MMTAKAGAIVTPTPLEERMVWLSCVEHEEGMIGSVNGTKDVRGFTTK